MGPVLNLWLLYRAELPIYTSIYTPPDAAGNDADESEPKQ